MRKLLREPLVHFVLFGIALFIGHHFWAKWVARQEYVIEVSPQVLEHQTFLFADQFKRQPTEDDKLSLLVGYVEEEILVREALKRGMNEDTVVRRALAQKMRVDLTDNTPPPLPSEVELKNWYNANQDRFIQPTTIAFTHIYFSPGEHDDPVAAATTALSRVTDDNWSRLGNPFIENNAVPATDRSSLVTRFGSRFADDVFALPNNQNWQGPVSSAFGIHLIRIDSKNERLVPGFEDAKPMIIKRWQDEALRAANAQRLEDLIAKYETVIVE